MLYGWGLSVFCPEGPSGQAMASFTYTYPDVFLHIVLFCFRLARILERFVLLHRASQLSGRGLPDKVPHGGSELRSPDNRIRFTRPP